MGFWGSGLYANDSTSDVKGTYIGFLEEGASNIEAYEGTMEQCKSYIGSDEEPLFWYALAETQWKTGRLVPEVKEKALEWIEKGGGLDLWEESPSGGAGWKNTLEKLKLKLESPMPKEKKIPRVYTNPWNTNDVYAYQFHKEDSKEEGMLGKYMLFQKIGEVQYRDKKQPYMQVQLIDHVFDELPCLEDVNKYRILPADALHAWVTKAPLEMNAYVSSYKKSEYPAKYLTFLGNIQGPANKVFGGHESLYWPYMEYQLITYYQTWRDKEYETVEEGVFRYNREV